MFAETFFKHTPEKNDGMNTEIMPDDEIEERISEGDHFIRCAQCLNPITSPEEQMEMNGAHRHTFANPHGILFEVACFRSAGGCRHLGPATDDFTWFKGYAWRISVCDKCLLHVGWHYLSPGTNSFYGLITERIVYPQ